MKDVMTDLETLGTRPGCIVLVIGAVYFGPDGTGDELNVKLSIADQEALGLHQDPDTVAWWARQSELARDAAFGGERRALIDGLQLFSEFVAEPGVRVWGNGADFDNPILSAVYHAAEREQPWGWSNGRCYRTLKGLNPAVKLKRVGTHHNALDDARSQADHAVRLLHALGLWEQLR